MTQFRPCIDLHEGKVKQIVGGTLDAGEVSLQTNYVSDHDSSYFAKLYQKDKLTGGHVIKLGRGNENAALAALRAYPAGLQLGGGISIENAAHYLNAGASQVIVTSMLFNDIGHFQFGKLEALVREIGRDKIVLDLSCRRTGAGWTVAMNRWQTLTELLIDKTTLRHLESHAAEFLIHAADVEGKCQGIDEELVEALGHWTTIPTTYAGGARHLADLELVDRLSGGRIDLTIGSALDIFGGNGARYADCVLWNHGGGQGKLRRD